jgi:hypothetical protein
VPLYPDPELFGVLAEITLLYVRSHTVAIIPIGSFAPFTKGRLSSNIG